MPFSTTMLAGGRGAAVGGACREGRGRWSWKRAGLRPGVWCGTQPGRHPAGPRVPGQFETRTPACFWSGLPTPSHPLCPGVGRPRGGLTPWACPGEDLEAVYWEHLDGALPAPPTS